MNEIEFLALVTESRKRRITALRKLRDLSQKCKCVRCKATVIAARAAIKRG